MRTRKGNGEEMGEEREGKGDALVMRAKFNDWMNYYTRTMRDTFLMNGHSSAMGFPFPLADFMRPFVDGWMMDEGSGYTLP